VERFLTSLIATHTGIITSTSSSGHHQPPSPYNGTLPYQSCPKTRVRSFGSKLESQSLSAQIHLTSELLRFL
jgi:hypothetical protein